MEKPLHDLVLLWVGSDYWQGCLILYGTFTSWSRDLSSFPFISRTRNLVYYPRLEFIQRQNLGRTENQLVGGGEKEVLWRKTRVRENGRRWVDMSAVIRRNSEQGQ